jgi:hypothetical protein
MDPFVANILCLQFVVHAKCDTFHDETKNIDRAGASNVTIPFGSVSLTNAQQLNMKSSIFLALASLITCCRTLVVAPDPLSSNSFHTSEAVVMNQGDVWKEGEHRRYHHNRCEVILQRDGNFVVKRIIAPNPWHQFLRTAWTSGSAGTTSGFFRSKPEQDGSLVVLQRDGRGNETLVYTSNVGEPEAFEDYDLNRTHKLVISEECVLTVYRDGKAVWTNNRYGGLGGESGLSDYLQKGEMMYLNQC